MQFGESRSQREARLERQRQRYPELRSADVPTVLAIDRLRRQEGRTPTSFGLAIEETYTRYQPPAPRTPQPSQPSGGGLLNRALNAGRVAFDTVTAPARAAGGLAGDVAGVVGDRIGNAGRAAYESVVEPAVTNYQRPGSSAAGALAGENPAASARGAVSGYRNVDLEKFRDVGFVRNLPDEDLWGQQRFLPDNVSPRDIGAFGAGMIFDPLNAAVPGSGRALNATRRGVRGAVNATRDLPVGMGIKDVGEEAAEQAVPRVTQAASRGGPQSEAARLYIETATKSEEPVSRGIVEALEQASAAVRTDPQGVVSRLAGKVPGLRKVRDWDRPGLTMEKRLLEGHVARRGVESRLLAQQSNARYDAIRAIDEAFGETASTGGRVLDDLRVPGQHEIAIGGKVVEYPGSGTVYDFLQRPYAYSVGDDVRRVAEQWAKTDEGMRAILNDGFGAEIGHFVPERGGVYVPNVNVSQARQATLENLARAEAPTITGTGKGKARVFESGFERWSNDLKRVESGLIRQDAVFVPETDLRVLGYTADLTKAHAAGNLTLRAAAGGRSISEVKEALSPGLVAQRDTLRKEITSLRGRVQRAEQSMGRDAAVAGRLDTQARQTAARADDLAGREPFEAFDEAISELDRRAAALDQAARGPAARADLAQQAIPMLRDDLVALKDQYAEVKRAYDAISPQDFAQPQSMQGRYFPSAETAQIDELMRPAKDNVLTRTLEGWRSQVLAGDIGPLSGIQGLVAAASGRAGTTRAVAGYFADGLKGAVTGKPGLLLRPYTQDAMEQFIRENADLVQEYAFYTGRNVGGRLPAEIGQGGLLTKIPGFVDANEGMFNIVTRRQIEMFRRIRDDLVKAGYSPEEGAAAAADLSNKVLPLMTPARLGQSAAKAQEQRFLPTSLGFIRQPLALTEEAFSTMGKLATGKSVAPREKLALSIYAQMMGNLFAASVATAGVNALARDKDPVEAITNALDPNSRSFLAVSVGDQTIPLANMFRSPLRTGIGTIRNILGPAVEAATDRDIRQKAGASPVNYVTGRIGPQVRALGDTYHELTGPPWQRKYQGDNDLLRLLSGAWIALGGAAPIPVAGIAEEAGDQRKAGEFDPARLGQVATAEFGGFSLIPEDVDESSFVPTAGPPRPPRPPAPPKPPGVPRPAR